MSGAEYAASRGLSTATVAEQIASGQIPTHGRGPGGIHLVDPEAADLARSANVQPRVSAQAAAIVEARTAKERYAARNAQLDYERAVGSLLDRREVEAAFQGVGQAIRERLMGAAPLIAAAVAGVSELPLAVAKVEEAITRAIEDAVADIDRRFAGDGADAGG